MKLLDERFERTTIIFGFGSPFEGIVEEGGVVLGVLAWGESSRAGEYQIVVVFDVFVVEEVVVVVEAAVEFGEDVPCRAVEIVTWQCGGGDDQFGERRHGDEGGVVGNGAWVVIWEEGFENGGPLSIARSARGEREFLADGESCVFAAAQSLVGEIRSPAVRRRVGEDLVDGAADGKERVALDFCFFEHERNGASLGLSCVVAKKLLAGGDDVVIGLVSGG